ncbi:MAG: hypothetical protein KAS66_14170 [Candidatus Omnitrophica bacterium]|nr:hypothetical protein [Candidatus Omnitrophota bacterium]
MKKLLLTIGLMLVATLIFTPLSIAQVTDEASFDITVDVPPATGINIVAVQVIGSSFGTTPVTAFDFGFVSGDFNTGLGIWLPAHSYAIDVGVTGGGGTTDITMTYVEGNSPLNQPSDKTMGYKTVATFFTVTGGPAPADQTTTLLSVPGLGSKTLLKNLIGTGAGISGLSLNGGFFRSLIGIYPGDDTTINTDGGTPFTNSDLSGSYTGTLTVSATVI